MPVARNGTDTLISINGNVLGHQRDMTLAEETGFIDTSSKTQRERTGIPGRYSSSIEFDYLYVPSDAAFILLQSGMRNGTPLLVTHRRDAAAVESVSGVITSLSQSFPDQAEAVVGASLEITGAWVPV